MDKTICELFAGVGGFRLGFDRLESGWKTVWFSQWEPGKKDQWAHGCYVSHYGDSPDINGEYHTGDDICTVEKKNIPDHTLLVAGFPCQDYSVAHSLVSAKGIEGKKGVLWWQIRDTLIAKNPPFCLLENVDRLLKSPRSQRGRDFGVILACFAELGYSVEWRVVNAAQYGAAQRRRRAFIFAYKTEGTNYGRAAGNHLPEDIIKSEGFMAKSFPIVDAECFNTADVGTDIVGVSDSFSFTFENAGYMTGGKVTTAKVTEKEEKSITLGEILQKTAAEKYFIPDGKMDKWKYLKGAKRINRTAANGHSYVFSEGPIEFPDSWDKPGRTMLTSESTLNRSTHVVTDFGTKKLRLLTPVEAERLQGFDDGWTDTGMPERMRYFCMGNALVVPMITRMGKVLDEIIAKEQIMAEHRYTKADLIRRFDGILGKKFGEIDSTGLFEHVLHKDFKLQKDIAGSVIEQSVLGYPPDSKQEADLVVTENGKDVSTELKVTGMRISRDEGNAHFVAKEPMSVTGVGIFELDGQTFESSHFWNKLEHMLIVYYLYDSDSAVKPYDYKDFAVKGYEFHEFSDSDRQTLEEDWKSVHSLICEIVGENPGPRNSEWKERVKDEYLKRHGRLRNVLSYIDLAPKFPPRFRLKKPTVSTIIAKHFGYRLEQLPGRYTTVSDIETKLAELTALYRGKTVGELSRLFGIPEASTGGENKDFAERIIIKMFGGSASKMNQIELFRRFGLVAKSVTVTSSGGRTEDMKLFRIHFDELIQQTVCDDGDEPRIYTFEDSEMYSYFADNELLCIVFEEPSHKAPLSSNVFKGFRRLVFSDGFIDRYVRRVWNDTREKIMSGSLRDVVQKTSDGRVIMLKSGERSTAPNFMKSSQNAVFIRGSGADSSPKNKTECVNGIRILPQYLWIKGDAIVSELNLSDLL